MIVGVEVGGTFTDLVAIDGGRPIVVKVPSVPSRPDEGVLAAFAAAGIALDRVTEIVHGSTVATNAVLERKGARVAFVTTRGFRDLLFLQRHNRSNIFDLRYRKPEPLVARSNCYEVNERIGADGEVLRVVDLEEARRRLVPRLATSGVQAVAVCLINAYVNSTHEHALARMLGEQCPNLLVTLSCETSGEFREYERASTTVLSAYVQPVIDGYLGRLQAALATGGFRGRFSVMQSNGGRVPAAGIRRQAAVALLSGPAAGVVGAVRQAARSGVSELISFDMGGTSTDVCLAKAGRAEIASGLELGGLPIRIPTVSMHTVGAGGGSVVWRDDGGMLRVGPQSSGADPGPACYRRGGCAPTVTDAHVLCGTIRPSAFLGGRMPIDRKLAATAFEQLARDCGLTVEETAESAVRIAVASIAAAIQHISTHRGRDPRAYTLLAYGGAGPLHAALVADELGIAQVLIPPRPGVLSAFGLLASDVVHLESVSRRIRIDEHAPSTLRATWAEMRERADRKLQALGFAAASDFELWLDMRFVGQAYEIAVPIGVAEIDGLDAASLRSRFEEAHRSVFSHGGANRQMEIVTLRIAASIPNRSLPSLATTTVDSDRSAGTHDVFHGGRWQPWRVRATETLGAGEVVEGPCLVEDWTSAIVVPAGWMLVRDDAGNLTMSKRG